MFKHTSSGPLIAALLFLGSVRAEIPFEDRDPPGDIPESALTAYHEGRAALKLLQTTAKNFYANADKSKSSFEKALKQSTAFSRTATPKARQRFQELAKYNLAIAYQMTMEFKKAERVIKGVLRVRPKHYHAMVELGDIYAWQKDYTNALVWYDKAHYRVHQIEYYDRKNVLLKTFTATKYERYLDRYWRAHFLHMKNHRNGKSTDVMRGRFTFGNGLSERDFERNSLARAR